MLQMKQEKLSLRNTASTSERGRQWHVYVQ